MDKRDILKKGEKKKRGGMELRKQTNEKKTCMGEKGCLEKYITQEINEEP